MTLTQENEDLNGASTNTFEIGVYSVYDTLTKQFDCPISLPVGKVTEYFTLLVNDVASKYYGKESDFILHKIGSFNQDTGEIDLHFAERVSFLDSYIDRPRRRYQVMLQVLNYLPHGYFKMPDEMKKSIQERIDEATMQYVKDYVLPDIDFDGLDVAKFKDIYTNYQSYVNKC